MAGRNPWTVGGAARRWSLPSRLTANLEAAQVTLIAHSKFAGSWKPIAIRWSRKPFPGRYANLPSATRVLFASTWQAAGTHCPPWCCVRFATSLPAELRMPERRSEGLFGFDGKQVRNRIFVEFSGKDPAEIDRRFIHSRIIRPA